MNRRWMPSMALAFGLGFAAPSAARAGDDGGTSPPVDVGAILRDVPRRIAELRQRLKALEDRIAKDDSVPDPVANAATRAIEEFEPKATAAIGRTLGLLLAQYLRDQKDPEKAAAYQAILKAAGPVIVEADAPDLRTSARAALHALLDLVPTMRDPKGAEVLRDLLATLRTGLSEAPPAAVPEFGAGKPVLGPLFRDRLGLRSILREALEEAAGRSFGGATLEPLGSGLQGFYVAAVRADSKAAQMGLAAGDTIIRLGSGAATPEALRAAGHTLRQGAELSLTVIRQGKQITLKSGPR